MMSMFPTQHRPARRCRLIIALLLLFGLEGGLMASDENKVYVEGLPDDCTYDDGYLCVEPGEDDFLSRESEAQLVPAVYVNAFATALAHFKGLEMLTDAQKKLMHYKIGFTEDNAHYIVLFRALLMPNIVDGKATGFATASFGMTTKIWIDKKTGDVVKHLFYR